MIKLEKVSIWEVETLVKLFGKQGYEVIVKDVKEEFVAQNGDRYDRVMFDVTFSKKEE